MPPLGYENYNNSPNYESLELLINSRKFQVVHTMREIITELRESTPPKRIMSIPFSWPALKSQEIRYKANGLEPNQEVIAWVSRKTATDPIELFTQVATVIDGDVTSKGSADLRAWVDYNNVLNFSDEKYLRYSPQDRRAIVENTLDTVKFIHGIAKPGV